MSESIEISQARGSLAALALRAANGEEIVLTRYGKEVCRIIALLPEPEEPETSVAEAKGKVKTGKYDQRGVDDILRGVNRKK